MDDQLGVAQLPLGSVSLVELGDDVAHLHLLGPPVLHRAEDGDQGGDGDVDQLPVPHGVHPDGDVGLGLNGLTRARAHIEATLLRLTEGGEYLGLDPLSDHLVVPGGVVPGSKEIYKGESKVNQPTIV